MFQAKSAPNTCGDIILVFPCIPSANKKVIFGAREHETQRLSMKVSALAAKNSRTRERTRLDQVSRLTCFSPFHSASTPFDLTRSGGIPD
jgi:hypothetical protein